MRRGEAVPSRKGFAMSSVPPDTYFAPAVRDDAATFARKVRIIEQVPLLTDILDSMPIMAIVLNDNRQIVAANSAVYQALGSVAGDVLQQRPGEAVGCIRAKERPGGCGTSEHCVTCGAVHAVLESQKGDHSVTEECRIIVETPSGTAPLDLRVTATPKTVDDERFIIVVLEDISQAKRLEVLQKVFFHDVLNTVGCISGYTDYLRKNQGAILQVSETLARLCDQLVEEVEAQRDLMSAESGDLEIEKESVGCIWLLYTVRQEFQNSPFASERIIDLQEVWDGAITTDRRLALRVLRNMVKNALEATPPGGVVTLRCLEMGGHVVFTVHNPEVMPTETQLQIFQRSFSTKGHRGRGIGTYSMKLLGERYLGGRVEFESHWPDGTVFGLTLPKTIPSEANRRGWRETPAR